MVIALTYKLMANAMILGSIEILAEALTFGEKSGIGTERVLDLIHGASRSVRDSLPALRNSVDDV